MTCSICQAREHATGMYVDGRPACQECRRIHLAKRRRGSKAVASATPSVSALPAIRAVKSLPGQIYMF